MVAHRGASDVNAEHTLGAYVAVLDAGADALECDVRLTADGHLVSVHDRRVDRTANARGPGLYDWTSRSSTSSTSPPGRTRGPTSTRRPRTSTSRTRMLTLERLMQAVADYDRPVDIAIETKHSDPVHPACGAPPRGPR